MKRSTLRVFVMVLLVSACSDGRGSSDASGTMTTTLSGDGDGDGESGEGDTGERLDVEAGDGEGCGDNVCQNQIDLLFVIDNSGTMGEEQLNLAKNFPLLIQQLENLKNDKEELLGADVQIMVTTTDFGNPLCDDYAKHDPEKGAPIFSGCNERIDRFTGLDLMNPPVYEQACTDVCETDIVPENGDHFIAFNAQGDNVPDVPDKDVNGDGMPDGPVAQALACVGPQGIDGCGYEAPLENMLQGLNQSAWWNDGTDGKKKFLRDGAILAIAIITDEADCSVKDYDIFDPNGPYGTSFWNTKPGSGKQPSSAVCWNAGVICDGPDMAGVYTNCTSTDDNTMQPISRYTDYLVDYLHQDKNKEVVMLGILGVPIVQRDMDGMVVDGGVDDLVYRTWKDGLWPAGDILPDDWPDENAAYKEWAFGIGPGCTGEDGMGGFTGQAIPNTRVQEVCQALDRENAVRCCIESICDDDYSAAITCLAGIIQDAIVPIG
jgi:hypothetical protein